MPQRQANLRRLASRYRFDLRSLVTPGARVDLDALESAAAGHTPESNPAHAEYPRCFLLGKQHWARLGMGAANAGVNGSDVSFMEFLLSIHPFPHSRARPASEGVYRIYGRRTPVFSVDAGPCFIPQDTPIAEEFYSSNTHAEFNRSPLVEPRRPNPNGAAKTVRWSFLVY
jgi:hypothetical protein